MRWRIKQDGRLTVQIGTMIKKIEIIVQNLKVVTKRTTKETKIIGRN